MENEEVPKSNTRDVIDSVTGLVNAVPIYQDGLQPAVKILGKSLETVAKTVNLALEPLRGLVWGYDKFKDFMETTVPNKLKDIPKEKIITPDATIAGPLLESLKYTGHKEELKDMYANLLATAMNKDKAQNAHPSFVDIIKNMNSDEARIIKYLAINNAKPIISIKSAFTDKTPGYNIIKKYISFVEIEAECEYTELAPSYYENLIRLKLIDIPKDEYLTTPKVYDKLENSDKVKEIIDTINNRDNRKAEISKSLIELSEFGQLFTNACIEKI